MPEERRTRGETLKTFLLLLFLWLIVSGCSTTSSKKVSPAGTPADASFEIRFGTYNVFSGMRDTNQTLAVIRQMHADVIALQEIAPQAALMLDRALEQDYSHRCFSNGLGIVSRYPLLNPHFQRSQRGINGFLFAEVDHPLGRMQIANLHLDPLHVWTAEDKLMLPAQLLWRQAAIHRSELRQVLENLRPDLPTVLLGDFNSASHAATDKLRALGYIDSFAAVTCNPQRNYTLHYTMLGFRSGRRIDFIFHDRAFETTESWLSPGQPSDHDPVVSVLGYVRPIEKRPPTVQ